MKSNLLRLFIVLAWTPLVFGADLDTYTSKYEKKLQDIQQAQDAETTRLGQQYVKSLKALLTRVRQAGDLDKTTEVTEELKRFAADENTPEVLSSIPEVKQLQASYAKRVSGIDAAAARKIIALAASLDHALEKLQRSLVTSNKLDEAQAVQQARKRIQDSQRVEHAKAVHTAHAAAAPTPPAASTGPFPETTETFMGHYYYLLPVQYTFSDAREICRDLGGHLLAIDNEREYTFIKDLITRKNCSVWLDITDEKQEGQWEKLEGIKTLLS